MQIGIFAHIDSLDGLRADLEAAERDGIDSYWLTQGFGHDTLTAIAATAPGPGRMRVGTAVVPVQPRHPMALAQQALTTNQLVGGRLVVGLGPSHPQVVEPCWGLSYDRPVRYMREYLEAFIGALTQHVRFRGEVLTARGDLTISGSPPVPDVMVSALGPMMLQVAGAMASGTITWMVGPTTLRELTVPTIAEAAEKAGRPAPEVVVTAPVCVTEDPDRARREIGEQLSWYDDLPSYRAMLDREGLSTSNQLALVGPADRVREQILAYEAAGATTFAAQPFGRPEEKAAARELVVALAAGSRAAGRY